MTSSLRWTLRGMLTLAVALPAAQGRAEKLETPGAPAADAAPAPTGPAELGDAGQLVISPERLFGFAWRHQSGAAPANTTSFSLLTNPFGLAYAAYTWPRIGVDYFVVKGISLGGAAAFFRGSANGVSNTFFELAPRVGYVTKIGPWLSAWPRLGFTYVHDSAGGTVQYAAITLEAPLVVAASSHIAFTFGPSLDLGITGKAGNNSIKATDLGITFGLALMP